MSRRGFTLLEVMIAIAVLSMIGAITFKSFDAANDLKRRVESAEDRDQAVRGALDRIGREVSMTFLSEHYDHKRFRERPTFFKLKDGRSEADLIRVARRLGGVHARPICIIVRSTRNSGSSRK